MDIPGQGEAEAAAKRAAPVKQCPDGCIASVSTEVHGTVTGATIPAATVGPAMFVKSLAECPPLLANDGCRIFELLHPARDAVTLPYSFAIAEVEVGESSYRHRLRQTEIYFILNGRGRMHIDAETRDLGVGEACVIPADAEQWIDNIGDERLRFVAVVSPPWRAEDDERL